MSDTYDDDAVTADELLLEDALAGDPDALATVTADDELLGRFEALVSLRDAVRTPAPAVPDAVSEAHLAAALGAFDELHAEPVVGADQDAPTEIAPVVSIDRVRRRGWLAGAAAAAVGVIAVGGALSLGGGDGELTAGSTSESDSAESVEAADSAAALDDGDASAESGLALESADAAAEASSAPPATVATEVAAAEAVPEAELAADDALDDAAADLAIEEEQAARVAPEGPLDPRFEACLPLLDLPNRPWNAGEILDEGPLDDERTLIVTLIVDDFDAVWQVEFVDPTCETRSAELLGG